MRKRSSIGLCGARRKAATYWPSAFGSRKHKPTRQRLKAPRCVMACCRWPMPRCTGHGVGRRDACTLTASAVCARQARADTPQRRAIARAAVRELIDEALAEITVEGFTDAMRGNKRA